MELPDRHFACTAMLLIHYIPRYSRETLKNQTKLKYENIQAYCKEFVEKIGVTEDNH